MLGCAGLLLLLAVPSAGPTASRQNAAADAVLTYGIALGVDFQADDEKANHPSASNAKAFADASFGAWLDAQIQTPDDSIEQPPGALKAFVEEHEAPLWSLVAALEKDFPDWGASKRAPGDPVPFLLPVIRLERMLVAIALYEEQEGRRAEASRALEASWSLGRSFMVGSTVLEQILAVAVSKWHSGALRKMREPDLQWLGRFEDDEAWNRTLDAVAADHPRKRGSLDPWSEMSAKAFGALVDAERNVSRCELLAMSDDEMMRPAAEALASETSEERRQIRDVFMDIAFPSSLNLMRRAARVSLDRELTLRVLELRLAKAGSPRGAWPDELVDFRSAVCPGVEYVYRVEKATMSVRFGGSAPAPSTGSVLPLEFRSRQEAAATPTPTPDPVRP